MAVEDLDPFELGADLFGVWGPVPDLSFLLAAIPCSLLCLADTKKGPSARRKSRENKFWGRSLLALRRRDCFDHFERALESGQDLAGVHLRDLFFGYTESN